MRILPWNANSFGRWRQKGRRTKRKCQRKLVFTRFLVFNSFWGSSTKGASAPKFLHFAKTGLRIFATRGGEGFSASTTMTTTAPWLSRFASRLWWGQRDQTLLQAKKESLGRVSHLSILGRVVETVGPTSSPSWKTPMADMAQSHGQPLRQGPVHVRCRNRFVCKSAPKSFDVTFFSFNVTRKEKSVGVCFWNLFFSLQFCVSWDAFKQQFLHEKTKELAQSLWKCMVSQFQR